MYKPGRSYCSWQRHPDLFFYYSFESTLSLFWKHQLVLVHSLWVVSSAAHAEMVTLPKINKSEEEKCTITDPIYVLIMLLAWSLVLFILRLIVSIYFPQALMSNIFHFCLICIPMSLGISAFYLTTNSILTKIVPPADTGKWLIQHCNY